MDIQDLGAIGEFVSSIVIVVTLMVLIYEVRGAKRATFESNAQERQRRRDTHQLAFWESPDFARIMTQANQHLGRSIEARAAEFGLEPDEFDRLQAYFRGIYLQLRDAYVSDLPENERISLDSQIRGFASTPAFLRWYDSFKSVAARGETYDRFHDHIEEVRATL